MKNIEVGENKKKVESRTVCSIKKPKIKRIENRIPCTFEVEMCQLLDKDKRSLHQKQITEEKEKITNEVNQLLA